MPELPAPGEHRLARHVAWLLSDSNLNHDAWLRERLAPPSCIAPLPAEELARFPRIAALGGTTSEAIRAALERAGPALTRGLIVSPGDESGATVARVAPFVPTPPEELQARSIVVAGFPGEAQAADTADALRAFFSAWGAVTWVGVQTQGQLRYGARGGNGGSRAPRATSAKRKPDAATAAAAVSSEAVGAAASAPARSVSTALPSVLATVEFSTPGEAAAVAGDLRDPISSAVVALLRRATSSSSSSSGAAVSDAFSPPSPPPAGLPQRRGPFDDCTPEQLMEAFLGVSATNRGGVSGGGASSAASTTNNAAARQGTPAAAASAGATVGSSAGRSSRRKARRVDHRFRDDDEEEENDKVAGNGAAGSANEAAAPLAGEGGTGDVAAPTTAATSAPAAAEGPRQPPLLGTAPALLPPLLPTPNPPSGPLLPTPGTAQEAPEGAPTTAAATAPAPTNSADDAWARVRVLPASAWAALQRAARGARRDVRSEAVQALGAARDESRDVWVRLGPFQPASTPWTAVLEAARAGGRVETVTPLPLLSSESTGEGLYVQVKYASAWDAARAIRLYTTLPTFVCGCSQALTATLVPPQEVKPVGGNCDGAAGVEAQQAAAVPSDGERKSEGGDAATSPPPAKRRKLGK